MTSQRHTIRFQGKGDRYRAFTLIELLVSMAITAILMLAMGSAMLVATHAMPDPNRPANQIIVAGEAAEQLATELQYAVTFTERTATAVEFTVADRDANGVPETIRYAWSGTAGDPLTRQYNGGTEVTIAEDVQEFDLSYHYRQGEQEAPTQSESAEVLLLVKDTADSGVAPHGDITASTWMGTYFAPSLPGDAISWRITRTQIYAKYVNPKSGGILVQVRTADAGLCPTDTVLDQVAVAEGVLPKNFGWYELTPGSASGLSPTEGVCIVIQYDYGSSVVATMLSETHSAGDPTPAAHTVLTEDSGASWTAIDTEDLWIRVWGTYTTQSEPPPLPTWLSSVGVQLRVGPDPATRIDGGVQVLNAPEVPAP